MREFHLDDLDHINAWYAARSWPALAPAQVKMRGFIVPNVAVGFLMQTDAGVAYLENFCSNPAASPKYVARAIDQITAELFALAISLGIEAVAAFTLLPSIEKRGKRLGMNAHPQTFTLMTKRLI